MNSRQLPCRQWWQLCQESLSALYPDKSVSPPSSTHCSRGLVKIHQIRLDAYKRVTLRVNDSINMRNFAVEQVLLSVRESSSQGCGTLFSLTCLISLSVITEECCLATKHHHVIASPWGGANTHTYTTKRAHLLGYRANSNLSGSDISTTNTEWRWERMLRSRRRASADIWREAGGRRALARSPARPHLRP